MSSSRALPAEEGRDSVLLDRAEEGRDPFEAVEFAVEISFLSVTPCRGWAAFCLIKGLLGLSNVMCFSKDTSFHPPSIPGCLPLGGGTPWYTCPPRVRFGLFDTRLTGKRRDENPTDSTQFVRGVYDDEEVVDALALLGLLIKSFPSSKVPAASPKFVLRPLITEELVSVELRTV
eukprot:CAMPEP_0113896086 /NCGR_PEP_ID=MMETSP0780_2-20120614/17777_1 /TAXON_ID=652834 /ORGANISM="Palpitomonas bilix" /LENGTH=174 /DNA_ID=CAMNT_0000887097 /DNA_START=263 /DNA_END=787 /DNA_ORIENTATION=+ /assembly_acc=CAM_ASM_000599